MNQINLEDNTPSWLVLEKGEMLIRMQQLAHGVQHGYGSAQQTLDGIEILMGPPYPPTLSAVKALVGLTGNIETDPKQIDNLANHERSDIRVLVASHPLTSPNCLVKLLEDDEGYVRLSAAGNPHTPSELLPQLALSPDRDTRFGLASNCALPESVIKVLAEDPIPDVRQRLARNGTMPIDILQRLASDTDTQVHWGIASNPCISPTLAEQMSRSSSHGVRYALACNPSTPAHILTHLATDSSQDMDIRVLALENPSTPKEVVGEVNMGHRYRFSEECDYRHVVQVPQGKSAADIEILYITRYLNSSLAAIVDNPPNVGMSGCSLANDSTLLSNWVSEDEPGYEILIVDETVYTSFDLFSQEPMTVDEFVSSLSWELDFENYEEDEEILETLALGSRQTLTETLSN